MKIMLDDVRQPIDNSWVLVHSVNEFKELLLSEGFENITRVTLDHDLGDYEYDGGTGHDAVSWLEELIIVYGYHRFPIDVHTSNPVAARRMKDAIRNIEESRDGLDNIFR